MRKILAVSFVTVLAGCGGGGDDADSTSSMLGNSTVVADASTDSSASAGAVAPVESGTFLTNAFQAGVGEIAISQLALERATDEDVRSFAQRMIDHHTQANNEIEQLAEEMDATLPEEATDESSAVLETLSGLSGVQFDQAYLEHNVAVHERDVSLFRAQALTGTGDDIRIFALNTLPALQTHLFAAKGLNGAIDPDAFLMNAYQDGTAEIALSTLALEKSGEPEVRTFAQLMVDEHMQGNDVIAQLAEERGLSLPSGLSVEHQAAYDDMAGMSGADFDKAYMNHNVLVHELSVAQALAQSESGTDAEVSALASAALPALSTHLERAIDIFEGIEPSALFVAFQDGLGEILLSKLALQKSEDAEVRQYAQTMIADHAQANSDAIQLAEQDDRTLPHEISPEMMRAYVTQSQLSGTEFDQAYMAENLAAHADAVEYFQQVTATPEEDGITAFVAAILERLPQHLQLAQQIDGRLNAEPQPQG